MAKASGRWRALSWTWACGSWACSAGELPELPAAISAYSQELHEVPKSCFGSLLTGTNLLGATALLERGYGNWCGSALSGVEQPPREPVDCWDNACRTHDYAFGRVEDGFASCHSVTRARALPDTQCTERADQAICEEWSVCTMQRAMAKEQVALEPGDSEIERCRGTGLPPTYCKWWNAFICEDANPCPCAGTEPELEGCPAAGFTPPSETNCGVFAGSIDRAKVQAFVGNPTALGECCKDYPLDHRPFACQPAGTGDFSLSIVEFSMGAGAASAGDAPLRLSAGTSFDVAWRIDQKQSFPFFAQLHLALAPVSAGDDTRFHHRNCGGTFALPALADVGIEPCDGNERRTVSCQLDAANRLFCGGNRQLGSLGVEPLFGLASRPAGTHDAFIVLDACTDYPNPIEGSWCASKALPVELSLPATP